MCVYNRDISLLCVVAKGGGGGKEVRLDKFLDTLHVVTTESYTNACTPQGNNWGGRGGGESPNQCVAKRLTNSALVYVR
jgi:hypothetical protein